MLAWFEPKTRFPTTVSIGSESDNLLPKPPDFGDSSRMLTFLDCKPRLLSAPLFKRCCCLVDHCLRRGDASATHTITIKSIAMNLFVILNT